MKIYFKKLIISLMCLFFIMVISNASFASTPQEKGGSTEWGRVSTILQNLDKAEVKGSGVSATAQNILGTIVNVIRIVGTGISIIMLTYIGIKYMSAAPAEKAEFKKTATAFVVGALVLFASTNILAIIANFASANIKVSG